MIVAFDLDGTLIDSSRALLEAHDVAFKSIGVQRPEKKVIFDLVGLPLTDTMRRLAPGHDAEVLAEAYSRAYVHAAKTHERLFEGIQALLSRPFRAAVATGKSQQGAERAVVQHGLADRFEIVLGGNSVPRPKPYPDMLQAIMQATNTTELVMVGDTTYDLEMAAAAGVKGIGVAWGHHSVERLEKWAKVVHSVDELSQMLETVLDSSKQVRLLKKNTMPSKSRV